MVTVDDDGKAVKLRGNSQHPYTQGGLCKKVNPWLEFAVDPSRLMTPLRRVGAKGSGSFEPISWDEALAEIAEKLLDVRDAFGGEAIWPFFGTGNVGRLQGAAGPAGGRLWNALGASQHSVSICSISGHVGMSYTTGTAAAMDSEDIVHAGVVLIWGSNTLVANQHLWPFVEEARLNGTTVVVIDPARTRTAERADHHLALLPGTDGALALGLCRSVLNHGGADPAFLADCSLGWSEFEESLSDWTVERAAAVCGLSVAEIDDLGRLISDRSPLAIKLGQGMQRHAFGGQAARVVSCLPALTGAYGRRGGGLTYSSSPAYQLNNVALSRPDLRPHPVRSLAMTNLGHNLTQLEKPVKALVIYGANPLVSNPQVDLVRRGLERDDLFTVAIDIYSTQTTSYADIVLPSAMQHEQTEINDSFAHLYLNWNEPAIDPPGECLPHTEIFRRLAAVMGDRDATLADPILQASDHELAADLLSDSIYSRAGITVEKLRSDGFVRIPGTDSYQPFANGFPTTSGRFEFTSDRAESDGHGRIPHYRPPTESARSTKIDGAAGAAGSMFDLVARGGDWHVNSVFAGTAKTLSRTTEPPLDIDPSDATRQGLATGDRVCVSNERGAFEATIRVGGEARPGVAVTTKGWWNRAVNATVREQDSDMGRGAVFHDNAVSIVKIGPGHG